MWAGLAETSVLAHWQRGQGQQCDQRTKQQTEQDPLETAAVFLAGDIPGEDARADPQQNEGWHGSLSLMLLQVVSTFRGEKEQ
jgi:hypothetical protein